MDENMNVYQNPLTGRYASKEMSYNWSPQRKHSTWRRLWLALAESEKELGLPITDKQLDECGRILTTSTLKPQQRKKPNSVMTS